MVSASALRARALSGRPGLLVRAAVVVLCVGVAYNYSLLTLLRGLALDTPLAYLGLVPAVAVALAVVLATPAAGEPTVIDRQVDYIVGSALIAAALVMVSVLPARLSELFWTWRLDLLSLPLFAAGAVALVFGVRLLWRIRLAVLFLLLAWPLPYLDALGRWFGTFSAGTLAALRLLVRALPVAAPVAASDGSLFRVAHPGHPFLVSVAAACTGADGAVGLLLLALAGAAVARGGVLAKAAWIFAGLVGMWLLNLLRLLVVFATGAWLGPAVALDVLHPVLGIALFAAGVAALVAVMPWFRLRRGPDRLPPAPPAAARRARASIPLFGLRGAAAVLLGTALLLGLTDAGMRQYAVVADNLGVPRLTSLALSPPDIPGFTVRLAARYTWAQRFFGPRSSWDRFSYLPLHPGGLAPPVLVDVISVADLGRLSAYGLQACYRFHGYRLTAESLRPLGDGLSGTTVTFVDDNAVSWDAVSWVWPVRGRLGYQRVVVLRPALPAAAGTLAAAGSAGSAGSADAAGSAGSATAAGPLDWLGYRLLEAARSAGAPPAVGRQVAGSPTGSARASLASSGGVRRGTGARFLLDFALTLIADHAATAPATVTP